MSVEDLVVAAMRKPSFADSGCFISFYLTLLRLQQLKCTFKIIWDPSSHFGPIFCISF